MIFEELALSARMVSRIDALGLTHPTPIQEEPIPQALQGRDILGIAQTGTGMTAAFGIPLIVALSKHQIELLDGQSDDRALVFSRTRHGAERHTKQPDWAGCAATSIHGNKSQGQRDRAIFAFKDGSVRVLVSTDVSGIDIPGVGHVYTHDLPNVPENDVHRIGRTARAGRDGCAVAFCAADEVSDLKAIKKVLARRVETAGGRAWEGIEHAPKAEKGRRPRQRSSRRPERMAA